MKIIAIVLVTVSLFGLSLGYYNPLKYKFDIQKNLDDFSGITKILFKEEYKKYVNTGEVSSILSILFDVMKLPIEARTEEVFQVPDAQQTTMCALCRSVIGVIMDFRRDGMSDDDIKFLANDLCLSFEIQPAQVCQGAIELNAHILLYIIDNRPNLTEETICGLVMQGSNCILSNFDELDWSVNIDTTGGVPINDHKRGPLEREDDDIQIVHITDIHYDPHYRIGSNANCPEATCCRTGTPAIPQDAAKRWGDYRSCDSPWETVPDLTDQITHINPDIDYVYYTGDILDHGIWETTKDGNIASIRRVFRQFADAFGSVPVFPILGNHEAHPTNLFPPTEIPEQFSNQWLYDLVAEEWSQWLRDEGVNATILEHGFYTVLVRPGFRVIGLNNQDCYNFNFWLMYEPSIGYRQLQWLHDTLLEAEANNEKVHILAHIPSGGGGCFRVWSREYRRIIDRFWNTVTGVFNGHTHNDEFNIFYSRTQPSYAINVGFNGGSATTYSHKNHNYKVYYVNSDSYQVVDYDNYIFNLTEANVIQEMAPRWFINYSFRDEYGVPDLTPGSLHDLTNEFAANSTKLFNYWANKVKLADTALASGCDEGCLAGHLCQLVTTEFGSDERCRELLDVFTLSTLQKKH